MDLPLPYGEARFPPKYTDLAEANKEIRRLQKAVLTERERVATMAVKRAQDNRANAGTHKVLFARIVELEAELAVLKGPK